MSLLKKRQRSAKEAAAAATVPSMSTSEPTLESIHTLFASVLDHVVATKQLPLGSVGVSSSSPSSSTLEVRSTLLQLGEWQRHLYDTLTRQQMKLVAYQHGQIQKQRQNMAVQYERAHLQQQIAQCQKVAIPHLEQLAREETGTTATAVATSDTTTAAQSRTIISQFLQVDVNDPSKKQVILQKLQQGLKQRAVLEKEVQRKELALLKTQQDLKAKQVWLRSLATHLTTMERSSQGLVKLMSSNSSSSMSGINKAAGAATTITTTTSSVQHMTGAERWQRMELAQKLPPPLYTLYNLLQHCVDETTTSAINAAARTTDPTATTVTTIEDGKIKLLVVKSSSATAGGVGKDEVVLQLPVLDVGTPSNKKRVASIHFCYADAPIPVVTVHATGCSTTLRQDVLLDELFPGDCALDMSVTTTTNTATTTMGKAYQWSNHLAGLYPTVLAARNSKSSVSPPTTDDGLVPQRKTSTRVVVRELQRRIRANATLQHILYSLQRHHVPVPPLPPVRNSSSRIPSAATASLDVTGKPTTPSCKLVTFSAVEDRSNAATSTTTAGMTTYQVILVKGPKMLQSTVRVHTIRYPAVPPVWSFHCDKEVGKSPLYDNRLAQLAHEVNVETLRKIAAVSGTPSAAEDVPQTPTLPVVVVVDEEDDAQQLYGEWILVHQLRQVMLDWDSWTEENSVLAAIGRKRKGRERKFI